MIDPLGVGRAWGRADEVGPPVDVYETVDAVLIRVAVPGAEGASLSLTVDDDRITLRGESPWPGRHWGDRTVVHCQEIPYGRFERTVRLPSAVQKEAARAQYRNGLLELVLPKTPSRAARTVQIPISM